MKKEEDNHYESYKIVFTEKRWYESLGEYLKRLPEVINIFLTSAISFWAFAKIIMAATDNNFSIKYYALPVFVFSLTISLHKAYLKQKEYVPEALKSESFKTQEIFRKQKCGWHAAIARQMLTERIQKSEATLNRIKRGSEFIKPKEIDYEEYIKWLLMRPEMMQRLLQSINLICTKELPSILADTTSEEDLQDLRNEIEALANMYEVAKDAEIECHKIIPPDKLKNIHEMTYGWTDSIRNGVSQFIDILDEIANVDREEIKNGNAALPSFEIDFKKPENISEYCKRIDEIKK